MVPLAMLKIDLRKLILLLTVVSVLITLTNALYAIYKVERDLLVKKTMASNQVYAQKIAETTDRLIESAQQQLAFSAQHLGPNLADETQLMAVAGRLHRQTNTFNSVVIVRATGTVVAMSPQTLRVKGARINTESTMQSLRTKRPLITDPFVSPAGNYLISISHPILSEQGEYLGYISGSIYLDQHNLLSDVLSEHSYNDGSYVYVVDRNKTLIYHPDAVRIGQVIENNAAINQVLAGHQGARQMVNSLGIDMLAGFSPAKRAGWGIVVQRPKKDTLSELSGQMMAVFVATIPIGLLTLAGIWISAVFISRPLWQLAREVKTLENHEVLEHIQSIRSWYFEARELKHAITKSLGMMSNKISQLDIDSHTDPMTNLLNRRGMLKALDAFSHARQPFSVLALDIDRFKQINDTYGHNEGDHVITAVADLMRLHARKGDILCRSGGEEFLIFLTDTRLKHAFDVAERLRETISTHVVSPAGRITVSIGLAYCSGDPEQVHDTIKQADSALYQAKAGGRNRTVCHEAQVTEMKPR